MLATSARSCPVVRRREATASPLLQPVVRTSWEPESTLRAHLPPDEGPLSLCCSGSTAACSGQQNRKAIMAVLCHGRVQETALPLSGPAHEKRGDARLLLASRIARSRFSLTSSQSLVLFLPLSNHLPYHGHSCS